MKKEDLKAALVTRDFERAQNLIAEWGARVREDIKAASTQAERQRIFDDALAFAEGNVYLTRVVRAHISAELQANSASFLYRDAESEQHRWQIKA
jgi:hypothetical protein